MNSTLGAFLPAFAAALEARSGLSGVTISTGPLVESTQIAESIEFGHVDNTIEWHALGRRAKKETYKAYGWIFTATYGGDEGTITTARNRALAILEEVASQLIDDPSIGGVVTVAALTGFQMDQAVTGANTNARGCGVQFELTVEAIIRQGA